jgi:hypothetical protein
MRLKAIASPCEKVQEFAVALSTAPEKAQEHLAAARFRPRRD